MPRTSGPEGHGRWRAHARAWTRGLDKGMGRGPVGRRQWYDANVWLCGHCSRCREPGSVHLWPCLVGAGLLLAFSRLLSCSSSPRAELRDLSLCAHRSPRFPFHSRLASLPRPLSVHSDLNLLPFLANSTNSPASRSTANRSTAVPPSSADSRSTASPRADTTPLPRSRATSSPGSSESALALSPFLSPFSESVRGVETVSLWS